MYYYYHQAQCNRQQNPCSFRSRQQPQVSKEGRREGRDCLLRGPGAWPCAQASQAPCPVPPARLPRRYCCLRVVVSDSSLSASHLVSIIDDRCSAQAAPGPNRCTRLHSAPSGSWASGSRGQRRPCLATRGSRRPLLLRGSGLATVASSYGWLLPVCPHCVVDFSSHLGRLAPSPDAGSLPALLIVMKLVCLCAGCPGPSAEIQLA
jgi:hypothetical protein